ncbi:MAG: CvpA family protein [Planctomycetaceae bacterium]|nr:CvpA family protein [Planctomycetaceae bacterium]
MWYDVFIAGILAFFAIRGAMKGVVWQLAGIAGIVLCFVFADGISAAAGPYVHLEPPLNHWVVLFVSYLVFSFVCFGIARSISTWIEKNQMKEFDRHLGAVFGLLKGVILSLILTFLIVTVSQSARVALKDSYSGKGAAIIMDRLHPILPEKLHNALAEYIHLLDNDDLPLNHSHDHDHGGEFLPTPTPPGSGVVLGESGSLPTNPGTTIPTPGTIPGTNPQTPTTTSFWSSVQNALSTEAQRVVADAIQRASTSGNRSQLEQEVLKLISTSDPVQRQQLQQQIVQAGSVRLEQYLLDKVTTSTPTSVSPQTNPPTNGSSIPESPTTNPQTPTPPATPVAGDPSEQQLQLVRAIASVYSTIPTIRAGIEQQIYQAVQGIPVTLQTAVLADWKADLWGDRPDPDANTGPNSTVDQRIISQLGKQGIPLSDLSPLVQQRLQQAQAPRTTNPL